jgi:hypothetical protein
MKKFISLFIVISIVGYFSSSAQNLMEESEIVVTLNMEGTSGNNGTAVIYNQEKEIYYAAFAGNSAFPLELFDKYGKHLYEVETGFDVRGLWYNPKQKRIEGNAYSGVGIYYKTLNARGYPDDNAFPILENVEVPSPNIVGTFNPKKKVIYYLFDKSIMILSSKDHSLLKSIELQIPTSSHDINSSCIFYTGVMKMEFALLDAGNKQLLVYDKKGNYKGAVAIHVSFEIKSIFNASFANGYLFLFDKDNRDWVGMKVFR